MKHAFLFLLLAFVALNVHSQGDVFHIESTEMGVMFPKSISDPDTNLKEGMIYFSSSIGRFKVYTGTEWRVINDNGRDGADGADAPQGPAGPQGDHVWYGLACWDINGDGIFNSSTEDKNGDLVATISDCDGGNNGAFGGGGDPGLPYRLSKQATSGSCLEFDDSYMNGKPDLVILQTYRRTIFDLNPPPVLETVYTNGKWSICSTNGSTLPNDSKSHYDLLVIADLTP